MTESVHSPLVFAWFGLVLIASVGLYRTSDRVQHLDIQLRQLNANIESEQQRLHVLKAEWTYLSNPARLAASARKHLALRPTTLKQIASLDEAAHLIQVRGAVASAPASVAKPASKTASVASPVRPRAAVARASQTTAAVAVAASAVPASEHKNPEELSRTSDRTLDQTRAVPAKTASAQPLPDSINGLLARMEAHP